MHLLRGKIGEAAVNRALRGLIKHGARSSLHGGAGGGYNPAMDLICYLNPIWRPLIRPAEPTRDWMTDTPESFPYRCLPLNIANAHGWEILSPYPFDARWTGGPKATDVDIMVKGRSRPSQRPVSIFGHGVLTFHVEGLFRTDPGWNLWIGGSPNRFKDGISPLTGIVETDWSPYSFTMNWRFTRPNHWVSFEEGEVIGFFFPVQRGQLETVRPRFEPLGTEPELNERFETWSQSRNDFQARVNATPGLSPADKWQKSYYRGEYPDGAPGPDDHRAKMRLAEFAPLPTPPPPKGKVTRRRGS